jgi:DNA invertase Pin-like site-specific DNA recombinase
MIEDCKAGKIDMIITKSISRFARNTLDTLNYVRMLKELDVGIIFEKENISTLDSKSEVLLTILSSLAQEESFSISVKF